MKNTSYFVKSKKIKYILFWVLLILFTNPGGILLLVDPKPESGVGLSDIIFAVLLIIFIISIKREYFYSDQEFLKMYKYLLIFFLYYLVVFSFFIPQFKNNPGYTVLGTFVKVRFGLMNVLLVPMIYFFFLKSYRIFFQIFLFSSIIILLLFIFSVLFGLDILPLLTLDRRFVSIDRIFMVSYGIMPILMTMGIVVLVFKFQFLNRFWVVIGFLLMSTTWILSLLRRQIFGTLLLFFVASVVFNYIHKRSLVPFKRIFSIAIYVTIIVILVNLILPKYIEAVESSIEETFHIIQYGETIQGNKDARLGFGKFQLQNKIEKNYLIGTGFDNNWRISEEAGYEASDYPFLSAIAMVGIVGLLFFVPVYFSLYKNIYNYMRLQREIKLNHYSFETYLVLVFAIYFVYDFFNYTYWFLPVSLFTHSDQYSWYIFLGLFYASKRIFENKELKYNYE